MSYTSYQTINSLEEAAIMAGGEFTLYFTVYEQDGVNILDISSASAKWVLCPYGNTDYPVLQKTGIVIGAGTFKVELLSEDTLSLSGKYTQQPIIIAFDGTIYRPAQGTILFSPAIPVT